MSGRVYFVEGLCVSFGSDRAGDVNDTFLCIVIIYTICSSMYAYGMSLYNCQVAIIYGE